MWSASSPVARGASGTLWNHGDIAKGPRPRKQIGNGWQGFSQIETYDMTFDGIIDILGIDASGNLRFYPGLRKGGFGKPIYVASGWQGRKISVVHMNRNSNTVHIIASLPNGDLIRHRWYEFSFSIDRNATKIGHGWQGFEAIHFGFFDADANVDAIAQTKSGDLLLYRTNGDRFVGGNRKIGHGWKGIKTSSWQRMNDVGGVIGTMQNGELRLYSFNNNGGFRSPIRIGNAGWKPMYVARTGTLK